MKHNLLGVSLALLMLATASFAQGGYPKVTSGGYDYDHGELGAFINYTRLGAAADTNFYGVGGRSAFNIQHYVALEAEGAYDFEQNVNVPGLSGTASPVRIVHFMFGPKFQWGSSGPVRVFVTAKGGLENFSTDRNFFHQVGHITSSATDATFYPGGGIEFFTGWFGVRFEAGDEMYFSGGVYHNLRVTAGPVIRF